MTARVQCGLTAGLAIVGASVLAIAPLTLPMPSEAAPVTADVELTATPLEAAAILVGGLGESGIRAGSGAALAPLSPILAGTALAYGDNQRAYSVIRQSIDAPLWAADPAINALAATLPGPIGGGEADNLGDQPGDGALVQFRDDVLWAATNAIRTPIRDALGADEPPAGENYAAGVGAGLLGSGERLAVSAAGAPLGLIPIAQAIANGSEEELYVAIRQYIDAPLYIADPTIDGLALALPKPLGGTDLNHEVPSPQDGQLAQFRDNVLWRATAAVRTPVADALGVDPNLDKGDLESNSNSNSFKANTVTNGDLSSDNSLANLFPGSGKSAATGGSSTSSTGASTTDRPRPVADAVKAINNQVKAGAERIDRTVKHLTGADKNTKTSTDSDK